MLQNALPIKTIAIHMCFPARKSVTTLVLPALLWLFGPNLRQRLQCHYGYPSELQRDLSEYRIPEHCLPAALGGTYSLDQWRKWVRENRSRSTVG